MVASSVSVIDGLYPNLEEVQGLRSVRETGRKITDPAEFQQQIRDRIMSLSPAHDLLVEAEWLGAPMTLLIRNNLETFPNIKLVAVAGPETLLLPVAVQNVGMALHELATNSTKYGVLATGKGTLSISWKVAPRTTGEPGFELTWDERFDQPKDMKRAESGFGTRVLTRVTPQSLMGSASLERTNSYVKWTIEAPLHHVSSETSVAPALVPAADYVR